MISTLTVGQRVGHAHRPLPVPYCRLSMVPNTLSLSWRIGRAIMLAEKTAAIANVGNIIVDAMGGPDTGRVLFSGKIVSVERRSYMGHLHGYVEIESLAADEEDDRAANGLQTFSGSLKSVYHAFQAGSFH